MILNDIDLLLRTILVILGAILPIANPPSDISPFLQLTAGCDEATRKDLARRVAVYVFGLLLGAMLIGPLLLRLFNLSVSVIQVAGGAVVVALGWRLLNEDSTPSAVDIDAHQASSLAMSQAFYPLTMPLSVGPGSLSVAVALGAHHAHTIHGLRSKFWRPLSGQQ